MAPLDVLDATFGPSFDLVAHHREVGQQLNCPVCGRPRPAVLLEEPAALVDENACEPLKQ